MKTKLIEEANHYDLIIIGGGPGGYDAAEHAGKHNFTTLGIEKILYLDKEGKGASKDMMYITLSADHRWIDRPDIGRFAKYIKDQIEVKFYERNF